ncbi:pilus assembly protein CpaE, partial [Yersinia thracica]
MQLILNKDLINRKNTKEKDTIAIISSRKWLVEKVSEKIRLADMNNIKEIDKSIFNSSSINLSDQTIGVIIDIGNDKEIDKILDLIKNNTPRDCWCVLVGDIDSISIAQQFTDRGILYLNIQSQSAELTQLLLKGIQIESERKAFFISVLGCKGGIGTTLLSYHLAYEITQIKKSPTLLLQGNQGSQDLDLVTEKKMNTSITEYYKYLDLMLCNEIKLSDIDNQTNKKHNFIIFDQPIHNTSKERTTDYIEQ